MAFEETPAFPPDSARSPWIQLLSLTQNIQLDSGQQERVRRHGELAPSSFPASLRAEEGDTFWDGRVRLPQGSQMQILSYNETDLRKRVTGHRKLALAPFPALLCSLGKGTQREERLGSGHSGGPCCAGS